MVARGRERGNFYITDNKKREEIVDDNDLDVDGRRENEERFIPCRLCDRECHGDPLHVSSRHPPRDVCHRLCSNKM